MARLTAFAVLAVSLAACAREAAPPPSPGQAPAEDEMGEPHDQSAFGRDPAERHVMSPDEPDLHPAPQASAVAAPR